MGTNSDFGFFLGRLRSVLGGKPFVLFSNLVELLHVLEEVWTSVKMDEELGFLAFSLTLWALYFDCFGFNFLESGVVVSKIQDKQLK
jgi:hypothetical protein